MMKNNVIQIKYKPVFHPTYLDIRYWILDIGYWILFVTQIVFKIILFYMY
jgi:hypothetical protein